MSGREQLVDERPGPFAWMAIVVGWAVMAVAVAGAIGDERLQGLGSWATWIVGAALVHDLVVLPAVLAVGWLLTRWVPTPWRVPMRTALVVAAVLTATVWPIARRWGARADNPSIVPLPVARNLTWIVVALFVTALGLGAVSAARSRARAGTASTEDAT
jgi:multisubunit Na+/H+ antiporter MnhC subunit